MGRLQGKIALITGAARGLGAAMARRFADEGARVIVNDLSIDAARAAAEGLDGLAVAADVADFSLGASDVCRGQEARSAARHPCQ